jgi:hypothetical protein
MLTTHPFHDEPVQVQLHANPHPPLGVELLQQVDAIWSQEQCRRQKENRQPLFNGELFCVDNYAGNIVRGHRSEYRFWVAQYLQPHLFAQLQMRPMSVAGLVICQDGVVFGKRGLSNTTGAGLWELIPSGGVETQAYQVGQVLDMSQQIQLEFSEEAGCDPQNITNNRPLCLIENHRTRSIDMGILLHTPQLTFAELQVRHATTSLEYTELQVVAVDGLTAYIEQAGDSLVSISAALLHYWMQHGMNLVDVAL